MDLVDNLPEAILEKDIRDLPYSVGALPESEKTEGHEKALRVLSSGFLKFLDSFRKSVDLFVQFGDLIL